MMRAWGRIPGPDPTQPYSPENPRFLWVPAVTDDTGDNSAVWLTNLVQVLRLNYGESPFYGNWGIPAHQSVVSQVAPDAFVQLTAQRFAPYFAALRVARLAGAPEPTYAINVTLYSGRSLYLEANAPVVPT